MAVTLRTVLKSAKSRGGFVGVSLKATSKCPEENAVVKVIGVSDNYVTLKQPDTFSYPIRVHKNTFSQVRYNGLTVNKR